mgnify:CR=1 FL=1
MSVMDKQQRAMLRAATDAAEERMDRRVQELRPAASKRVALDIPTSGINNYVDTGPIAEAISAAITEAASAVERQMVASITGAINSALSVVGNQPAPQVSVDMAPVALAISDSSESIVKLIGSQNEKIVAISEVLAQLIKVLSSNQRTTQQTTESSSVAVLVSEQREFFTKVMELITKKYERRQIRIAYGETESVVTEE